MEYSLDALSDEVQMAIAEGGLSFEQMDYLLYLETIIDEGSIKEEDIERTMKKVMCRDF